ncbi:PHAX RNA-binding domain-containing protein [Pelagophyceae sp. CCMP2097]|nr:PHAX RNA-binding domain-containing protein [Pelagophyceae sp. CCMP2097]
MDDDWTLVDDGGADDDDGVESMDDELDAVLVLLARLDCDEEVTEEELAALEATAMVDEPAVSAAAAEPGAAAAELGGLRTARGPAPPKGGNVASVVTKAAKSLKERNTHLMKASVVAIGLEAARRLVAATVRVQRAGGMLTADGARKRTAGGVFFELLKGEMPKSEFNKLMAQDKRRKMKDKERRDAEREKRQREEPDRRRRPPRDEPAGKRQQRPPRANAMDVLDGGLRTRR